MNARAQCDLALDNLPESAQSMPVYDSRSDATADQWVLEETPVALVYNGITHAVMLASPQDLEDFAVGFSLSENIVRHARDIFSIDIIAREGGVEVAMHIDGASLNRLKLTRRMRTGRTGCGLCGLDSLEQFTRAVPVVPERAPIGAQSLQRAMAALPRHQQLHQLTGAAHAAGWADVDGTLILVREDIGRHNALDKLIGAMARRALPVEQGFCVLTSRASYEMVQKAALAGIGLVAAVSAPSALAVRLAEQAEMALAGFVRNGSYAVYSRPERVEH